MKLTSKKSNNINLLLLMLLFLVPNPFILAQYEKTYLSEYWEGTGGVGAIFSNYSSNSSSRNTVIVGHTIENQNYNIIVQKRNRSGNIEWTHTYPGTPVGTPPPPTRSVIDNSVSLTDTVFSKIYVLSTYLDSTTSTSRIMVKRFNTSGYLAWTYTHPLPSNTISELGTGITFNENSIYISGISITDSNMSNFLTLSLNASTGSLNWENQYDYNNLQDYSANISYNSGKVFVTGASQDSTSSLSWSIATVAYDATTGTQNTVSRINNNAISGVNNISDFSIQDNHIYIVGSKIGDGTNLDIAIYKLDSDLNLIWEQFYDFNGLDDHANAIEVNTSGDIYITGYSKKSGVGKEIAILKANSSGTLLWKKEISGAGGQDDEGIKLSLNNNNIFIAASVKNVSNYDYGLYMLSSEGKIKYSTFYDGNGANDFPHDITQDIDGNIIVTGNSNHNITGNKNVTLKYNVYEKEHDFVMVDSIPRYLSGNILIKFKKQYIKTNVIDRINFVSAQLTDFVDSICIEAISSKTGKDWSKLNASKVFRSMTTADSLSITRLGDTIKAIDFWTTLSVDVPNDWAIQPICDSLDSLNQFVEYSSPNYIFEFYSTPNDELYETGQLGLYENPIYPNAHANVENAWDIETGNQNVKVGIIDSDVNWSHIEFNGSISNLPGPDQKIGGGYNYTSSVDLSTAIEFYNPFINHGTLVAGVIGAKRNNFIAPSDTYAEGIAGIAGGDVVNGNIGVQLFPLNVRSYNTIYLSHAIEAIRDGYSDSPHSVSGRNFGLNIINAAWGIAGYPSQGNMAILKDVIKECWQNHCIFVAARGHTSIDPLNDANETNFATYPACFEDNQLICVSSSGTNGELKTEINGAGDWFSLYGRDGELNYTPRCDVDVVAPGTIELISSTSTEYNYETSSNVDAYSTFDRSSASASVVTGIISLMYSQHHPVNGYPNKLVTEDVEEIIQKTANDRGATGFDLMNAHGLIDAFEAVKNVSNPYYVKHLKGAPTEISDGAVTINIQYAPGFTSGSYAATRYKIQFDIDEVLPSGHKIVDWWNVEAFIRRGVNTGTLHTGSNGTIMFQSTPSITNSGETISRTAYTYLYKLNSGPNLWYPKSPDQLKYGFSIHVKKDADVSVPFIEKDNFILFPNPSKNNIKVQSQEAVPIQKIQIFDVSGRLVHDVSYTNTNIEIELDISNFRTGMYYAKILSSSKSVTIPFIKQE